MTNFIVLNVDIKELSRKRKHFPNSCNWDRRCCLLICSLNLGTSLNLLDENSSNVKCGVCNGYLVKLCLYNLGRRQKQTESRLNYNTNPNEKVNDCIEEIFSTTKKTTIQNDTKAKTRVFFITVQAEFSNRSEVYQKKNAESTLRH